MTLDAPCLEDPGPTTSPPRLWVLIADWGNLLAGLTLTCAFVLGALMNDAQVIAVDEQSVDWLQFFFSIEGALFAIAEFFMVGIMALAPAANGGGARGAMQFAILMAGGVFFGLSGLVFPSCISNITHVVSKKACPHPAAAGTPYAWNAMAHYGITCFMIGTAIGQKGVLAAPKNKFISPFWGVTMFFLGAWTIGIFKFWGPVLAGGFDSSDNTPTFNFGAPAVTWTWTWWFGVLGATFLTTGAFIFAMMNGSFCTRRA